MMRHYLAPSILSADFLALGQQIVEAEAAGADWVHIDIIDGHFAPNLTMGPVVVTACRRATQLPLDVHLMVEKPDTFLESFAQAGATSLTVHVEACTHLHRTLTHIRELGCGVGVALNPGTPASSIEPVLHLVDLVLVMSVNPGFSGQEFIPEVLPKVSEIRRKLNKVNPPALIEIDGGITPETLLRSLKAGVQVFVAATSVYGHPDGIAAGVQSLREVFPKK
ncbi:MAG TPA: ribulose-phosphate 3-epimerase [Anaerolineales bacterium]|nr:ribulose-phosphate 3-epimerase [Anaerolineales bacterium]